MSLTGEAQSPLYVGGDDGHAEPNRVGKADHALNAKFRVANAFEGAATIQSGAGPNGYRHNHRNPAGETGKAMTTDHAAILSGTGGNSRRMNAGDPASPAIQMRRQMRLQRTRSEQLIGEMGRIE